MQKQNEGRSAEMKFAPVGAARNTKDAVGASFVNINDNSTSLALPLVEIYTDGGCEPNPGPGGYAAVLLHPKKRAEASGGFRETTNNRMEIYAAIAALELLKQPY